MCISTQIYIAKADLKRKHKNQYVYMAVLNNIYLRASTCVTHDNEWKPLRRDPSKKVVAKSLFNTITHVP